MAGVESSYRIGDDVKRVEAMNASFSKVALATGILLVLFAIWVRTPYLAINPAAVAGFSGVTGFNVGHAIVLGPILSLGFICIQLGILQRRADLMTAIEARLRENEDLANSLTDGDLQVLGRLNVQGNRRVNDKIERVVLGFWFFAVPPLAALWCLDRYMDFIPSELAKSWSFWSRVGHHLFSVDLWEIRPLLGDRHIEGDSKLLLQLPYIYSPLQAWIEIAATAATAFVGWRAARLYFRAPNAVPH